MKLTDTLEEQSLLEEELERTKPPGPAECRHLHYLLATPFRYGRYPGNSRFRREGFSPGVFYASEAVETALAETVFYRLLFFAESPGTPWPRNPLELTGFRTTFETARAIDLTRSPFDREAPVWTHRTDYAACLELADAARAAEIGVIRYRSVRDPAGGANLALLSCTVFTESHPTDFTTWRVAFSDRGANALCDRTDARIGFPWSAFGDDPRIARAAGSA